MARSPAHRFGQIVGEAVEMAIESLLRPFTEEHGLYLDTKGRRPARKGLKVRWGDLYGNSHDLDFVLEKDGTAQQVGTPIAFIETAWRSYTKHSRNKAQEIQGAILPLVARHQNAAPFIGVILAGVFTEGALSQLRSLGFTILYFPHDTVIQAFGRAGIDADFDEETSDVEVAAKVTAWEALREAQRLLMPKALIEINAEEVSQFMQALERAVLRQIESVLVLPLHGAPFQCSSADEAIVFVESYHEHNGPKPIVRYEVEVLYNNSDRVHGQFTDKDSTIRFLSAYQRPQLRPAR
jgi:hypothetical protein